MPPEQTAADHVVISVNCNGLRSFIKKGGMTQLLQAHKDVENITLCLQEIKMLGENPEEQLLQKNNTKDVAAEIIKRFPYRYYNLMKQTGLHGTAILTTVQPLRDPIKAIGDEPNDIEGRTLALIYPSYALVNSYCPCAGIQRQNATKRRTYMRKVTELLKTLQDDELQTAAQRQLIWAGDKNAIRADIDGHRRYLNNPGCQLDEQDEFRAQLQVTGLLDMFDYQDKQMPQSERFTWFGVDKDRKYNRGVRLDSIHVTPQLLQAPSTKDLTAHSLQHLHFVKGSDHVPVRFSLTRERKELNGRQVWPCWPYPVVSQAVAENQAHPEVDAATAALAKAAAQILMDSHSYVLPPASEEGQEEIEDDIDLLEARHANTELPIRRTLGPAGARVVPYVHLDVQAADNTRKCSAMADSGATKSLITEGLLHLHGFTTSEEIARVALPNAPLPIFEMAGGQLQRAIAAVQLTLTFTRPGQRPLQDTHSFYVLRKKSPELILGSDYLGPRQAVLSYKDKSLGLTMVEQHGNQGETVTVPFMNFGQPSDTAASYAEMENLMPNPLLTLVAPCTIAIPPRSQMIIEAVDPGGPRSQRVFGRITRNQNCVLMERGLATAHGYDHLSPEGHAKVAIMNSTPHAVTLREGEPVCSFEIVDEAAMVFKPAPPPKPPDPRAPGKPMTNSQRRRQARNELHARQRAAALTNTIKAQMNVPTEQTTSTKIDPHANTDLSNRQEAPEAISAAADMDLSQEAPEARKIPSISTMNYAKTELHNNKETPDAATTVANMIPREADRARSEARGTGTNTDLHRKGREAPEVSAHDAPNTDPSIRQGSPEAQTLNANTELHNNKETPDAATNVAKIPRPGRAAAKRGTGTDMDLHRKGREAPEVSAQSATATCMSPTPMEHHSCYACNPRDGPTPPKVVPPDPPAALLQKINDKVKATPLEKVQWAEVCASVVPTEGERGVWRILEMLESPRITRLFTDEVYPSKRHDYDGFVLQTTDEIPVADNHRRYSEPKAKEIHRRVTQLLEQDKIEPSNSPWASAVVLAPKPNGTWRFAMDMRGINKKTVGISYSLPRIDDTLSRLHGMTWVTTLDLSGAFHLLPIQKEADRQKTAFATPSGLYQWKVLPMGLKNASAIFSQFMDTVLGSLKHECVLPYLDDAAVVSRGSFDDHLRDVARVLHRFADWGLQLNVAKCAFFAKEVKFLGHIISPEGIKMDPKKIAAIENMAPPESTKNVRTFLGMSGYYRKFIKNYARRAGPLHQLLRDAGSTPFATRYGEEQQAAFDDLRQCLTTAPILGHPDWQQPFEIHCDACVKGLGATLVQRDEDGNERVIEYAGRALREHEKGYPQHKLEALALFWSIQTFRPFVEMTRFVVWTDNTAITKFMAQKIMPSDASGNWLVTLQSFDFETRHRKGSKHGDADGLSRLRQTEEKACSFSQADVSEPGSHIPNKDTRFKPCRRQRPPNLPASIQTVGLTGNMSPPLPQAPLTPESPLSPRDQAEERFIEDDEVSADFWRQHDLLNDVTSQKLIEEETRALENKQDLDLHDLTLPTFAKHQAQDATLSKRIKRWHTVAALSEQERSKLFHQTQRKDDQDPQAKPRPGSDEVLYKGCLVEKGVFFSCWSTDHHKLFVPPTLTDSVLRHFHGLPLHGHMGVNRTYKAIKQAFVWKGMRKQVRRFIAACRLCAKRKPHKPGKANPTRPLIATRPWQYCCIDFFGKWTESKNGYRYLLTIHDMFTRWPIAVPMKEKSFGAVYKAILEHVVYKHGCPEIIWSDREPGFAAAILKKLTRQFGSVKAETTPEQPQSNSSLERFHQYLGQALTFVVNKHRDDWDEWIEPVLFMFRISANETSGHSPYYMLFGRHPRLPVNAMLGVGPQPNYSSREEYAAHLATALHEAWKHTVTTQMKQKVHDKAVRDAKNRVDYENLLLPNTYVMVWSPPLRQPATDEAGQPVPGKQQAGKPYQLDNRWRGPFKVLAKCGCGHHRWIIHTQRKKLVKLNNNSLRAFTPYNDETFNTDPFVPMEEADKEDDIEEIEPAAVRKWRGQVAADELVLIPMTGQPKETFTVVKILERRPNHANGHLVQWYGNNAHNFPDRWLPGWLSPSPKGLPTEYYQAKPRSNHKPYTNDTSTTVITDEQFLPIPVQLNNHDELSRPVLEALADSPDVAWNRLQLEQVPKRRVLKRRAHSTKRATQRPQAADFF